MKTKKPKPYKVVIELELSPLHVWPDKTDPPPPDPSPEDVAREILASTTDMNEWFQDWNLGYNATVIIKDDQGREAWFESRYWSLKEKASKGQ